MTTTRTVARIALGSIMTFAGITHLTVKREEFQAQVPDWFPVDADVVVLASGVAEVALGASFAALPARKGPIAAALAAFFVLIFPGNIAQYLEHTDAFGLDTDQKRFVRLFFQPVLVVWALFGGGIWPRSKQS
jgi:uncharacterized membrane protein